MRIKYGKGSTTVRYLFFASWLIFFVMVSYFSAVWFRSEENPNQNLQTLIDARGHKQIILRANRNHQYVFNGRVNGHPVTFLVDTGATSVAIPGELAIKLNLEKKFPVKAHTANSVITVHVTKIKQIQIGSIYLHNIRATINPNMRPDYVLLGMSALRHLELYKANGILILRQKK